jgi:hypothetical protein
MACSGGRHGQMLVQVAESETDRVARSSCFEFRNINVRSPGLNIGASRGQKGGGLAPAGP